MSAAIDEVVTSTPKKTSSKKSKKSQKTDKSDTKTEVSVPEVTAATDEKSSKKDKKSSKKEKKSSKKEKKSSKKEKKSNTDDTTSDKVVTPCASVEGDKIKKESSKKSKEASDKNSTTGGLNTSIADNEHKPSLVEQLNSKAVAKEVGPAVLKQVNTSEMLGSTDGSTDNDNDSDDDMPQVVYKEESNDLVSDTEKDWEMVEAASGDEGVSQKVDESKADEKIENTVEMDTEANEEVSKEPATTDSEKSVSGGIISAITGAIGGLFSVTAVEPKAVVAKTWVPVEKGEDVLEKENKKKLKDEKRRKYKEAHGDADVTQEEKEALYVVKPKNYAEVESDHDSDDDSEVEYKSHVNDGISDLSDLSDDSDAETESEDEEVEEVKAEKKSKKPLTKVQQRNANRDRSLRTVFIGNVPIKCNQSAFKAQFKEYGAIESMRFRSVAVAKPKMSKMIAFVTKQTHAERTSMNAYIVYKTQEGCDTCLEKAKGTIFGGHHLRVDRAGGNENRVQDTKSTVFVGGLPPNVEDEMLYQAFAECGAVESVRIVRDKVTGIGKGIAYVKFAKEESVILALKLSYSEVGGKKIRVQKAMSKDTQNKVKEKKTDFQGAQAPDRKRKGGDDDAGAKKKKIRWDKNKLLERDAKEGTTSRALSRPDRTVFEKPAKPEKGIKRARETKEEKAAKKVKTTKEAKKAKKPKWDDAKRKEKGAKTKSEKHREKTMGKEGAERRVKKANKSGATKK